MSGARVVVTDVDDIRIAVYRDDGVELLRIVQPPLACLLIAERLVDAALRRLIVDAETRARFL